MVSSIELGQNWAVELYLNTENGLESGVADFRNESRGYEAISDKQIAEMIGRWYFQCWKYSYLSFVSNGKLAELNRKNYERFEQLYAAASHEESCRILEGFKQSASNAATRLKSSSVINDLNRTSDFTVKISDDDGLDYFTKGHL